MNKNYTDITVLLDRSGSMERIKSDMEGGFAAFLKTQQDDQRARHDKVLLSLAQFDTTYETVYTAKPVQEAAPLVLSPGASTALYDAAARCIRETGVRLAAMPEDERPGLVVMMIITDGEENASRETTAQQLQSLIRQQSEVYKWQFMYLGANQDAILAARAIGIGAQAAVNYTAGPLGTRGMYGAAGAAVLRGKRSVQADEDAATAMGFTSDERAQSTSDL